MLFLMQSNVLFRLFRLLAVQIAFIPADIRLISFQIAIITCMGRGVFFLLWIAGS